MQHGIDEASREVAQLAEAKRETEALYSIKNRVMPVDRDLFYSTIDTHYEQEPTSRGLRQWLHTWKPLLLQSAQQARTIGVAGIQNIRHYFNATN
jgi:hypothetical protein